jgi:hypothetical protein
MLVFGHSANNADKYIKYNILSKLTDVWLSFSNWRKLTIYNWQFNKLTICLYVPTPPDKVFSLDVMCLTSSYLAS